MSMPLSKLIDNLSEGIHNNKRLNCESYLDYIKTKNEKLILKCFNCKTYDEKKFNKELIKRFAKTYEFCNKNLNKSILLLRKGVYPYEYMDNLEKFDETSLPNKESFYSNLNMENIDDIDYRHGNNVFKRFRLKNLEEYHDSYVQSDTLLLADVFENFRNTCLKVYELDPAHFLSLPGLAWQACLKKTSIKLELLTDYDMLLMVEEGIRGGICHSIHRHAKANNKYMENYDENKESSYIQYLDANNLYGWAMSQKLPVNGFKWIENNEINEEFIKNYEESNDKAYIVEVDVKYPRKLHDLHSDLPFLPKRMKIDKCKNSFVIYVIKKCVVHIKLLKQALNHGLKLKKIHRIIEFNQEAWLKPYIDTNTELRKVAKDDFEKDLFKLMNNLVFGKTMENIRKHSDIKLVTTDMDTDSFIMNIKTEDFCKDIANDVENRFDTSNYEVNRPLPTGKNKKVIGLMKDELRGKIITEFVTLRQKTYSYLTRDCKEDKKSKGTKKCVIKRMIKFNDYKNCLLKDEVILKSQQRFISKKHDVFTENINKIALSNNDDKRIVSSDKITSYLYGYKGKHAIID